MLRLQHLSIVRGTRTLYDNVNLVASDGERIALVGENGSGKSSLFAAILGELSPESGTIDVPELVSEVAQSVEETDREALQYVLEGHAPLVAAQAEQFAAHESGDDMRIAAAAAHLAEINEGAVKAQALTIMNGLGFLPGDENRTVREFSGGWRNRLALARCLINPAQLLLLDEPTNHLDIDSLIWLEAWLKRLICTVIIISHDREFLDRAVQTTWAVEDGTITRYGGNYSFYEMQRVQNLRLQEANRKAYERTAAHLKSYIERFRYKATKARQAQSRLKMLERLEVVEPVRSATSWRFAFEQPERMPTQLVTLEDVAAGYGENRVLSGVNLCIRSGERIGVLGVNGAGKSTLIKTVNALEPFQQGEVLINGINVGDPKTDLPKLRSHVGMVFQHFELFPHLSITDNLTLAQMKVLGRSREEATERGLALLDRVGLLKHAPKFPGQLSGGQQQRVAIARALAMDPVCMLFDEPTSALDPEMINEVLDVMVELAREGMTMMVVTHEMGFARKVADRVIFMEAGEILEDAKKEEFFSSPRSERAQQFLSKILSH